VGGQRHVPAALLPRNISGTRCTGGWVCPRTCLDRPPPQLGFDPRTVPARSELLYRLSHPGPTLTSHGSKVTCKSLWLLNTKHLTVWPLTYKFCTCLKSNFYNRYRFTKQGTHKFLRNLTFWRRIYFFNFSTPVYKMWIIQEPNKLELWNKLHFEEEKTENIYRFMFLWPCIVSKAWRRNTNEMQQYRWFIVNCRCWLLTTVSTCFGHLYAHHQEKRPRVTAYGVFWGIFDSHYDVIQEP